MSFEVKLAPEELEKLKLPSQPSQRGAMRPARGTIVGGLLTILAVAVLLRSFVFTAGYNSTLVSDLGVVRAPVSGVVDQLVSDVGDRVKHDQRLGTFAAPVGLSAAVKAGSEDIEQLKAKLTNIDSRIQALQADAVRIRTEAGRYRREKSSQLAAMSEEAGANVSAAEARLTYSAQQVDRARLLARKGFVSSAGLDKAEQEHRAALAEWNAARARRTTEAIEASAAGQGLLLTSGYSDVQYSTQRLSELTLALSELQGQRSDVVSALESAQRLSRNLNNSTTRRLQMQLQASVDGRVWTRVAAAGESLREGDPIYMLADCSSFFAYFSVGRSTYSNLSVGQPVTFVAFSNGARWGGSIVNMGVGDPTQLRVTSQISAPAQGEYLIGARVNLPPEDRARCPVGTAGRVVL